MSDAPPREFFLWRLFCLVRGHGCALGVDDYEAMRLALRAGFGWASPTALRNLCGALWAKSRQERAIVEALFDELGVEHWTLPDVERRTIEVASPASTKAPSSVRAVELPRTAPTVRETPKKGGGLPSVPFGGLAGGASGMLLLPQYPLRYREVAQACRRLRRTFRDGPRTELDVDATIEARCRRGVAGPPVLVPRRRNAARLLVLVDREGSMAPFHPFLNDVCDAIQRSAGLARVSLFYFRNCPTSGADDVVLDALSDDLEPLLDPILPLIAPHDEGTIFEDRQMLQPRPLATVLEEEAVSGSVLLITDAGAARGRYDVTRLLETVAFMKRLRALDARHAWLNPVPRERWSGTTAGHIARYAPMFPLDRWGMRNAIDALRGARVRLERPV